MDEVSGAVIAVAGGFGGLSFALTVVSIYWLVKWFLGRRNALRSPYDRDHIVLARPYCGGYSARRAVDYRVVV